MTEEDYKRLGLMLAKARIAKGLTRKELAESMPGLSVNVVDRAEEGCVQHVQLHTLLAMAGELGLTMDVRFVKPTEDSR